MKQALASLLVFLVAFPASASYAPARAKTRIGGLSPVSANRHRAEWAQGARTRRVIVVCVHELAAVKPEDNNGNTLSETTGAAVTTYAWDKDNRLRTVTSPTSGISTLEYDANGIRTKKVEAGVETRYLLDGVSVLEELDGANVTTARYLNNPQRIDEQLAFNRGGADYWPLHDALGSIVAVSDANGALVSRFEYGVQGERTTLGAGPPLAFGFTGREHDANGKRYHRDRYANPNISAWLQPDPLGHSAGSNFYAYVRNVPTQATDPTGLLLRGPVTNSVDAALMAALTRSYSEFVFLLGLLGISTATAVALTKGVANSAGSCSEPPSARPYVYYRGLSAEDLREFKAEGVIRSKGMREGGGLLGAFDEQARDRLADDHLISSGGSPYVSVTLSPGVARRFANRPPSPGYHVAEIVTYRPGVEGLYEDYEWLLWGYLGRPLDVSVFIEPTISLLGPGN